MSNKKNLYLVLESFFFKLALILNKKGKLMLSEKFIVQFFLQISNKGFSPVKILIFSLEILKPLIRTKQIRIRGLVFDVPFPQTKSQQLSFILKLFLILIKNVRKKNKIAEEFIKVYQGNSSFFLDISKLNILAIKNKSFLNYRWF